MLRTSECSLSYGERCALYGSHHLVEIFVDTPLIRFLSVHKQAREDMEAAQLSEGFVGSNPFVGLHWSERQVLPEVETYQLGDFLRP